MLELTINIYVHCLILLSVLSCIFVFYVSKIVRTAVNTEIHHNITNLIKKLDLSSITKEYKTKILNALESTNLHKIYGSDTESTTNNNKWLFTTIALIVGLFYFTMIASLTLLSMNKVVLPDLYEIGKMNAIIFGCIGVVEYLFFTRIAVKYIPAPPSMIAKTVLEDVRKIIY